VSTGKIILVVLATVVIFAAGVVTGGMLVRQTIKPPASPQLAFNRFESARRAAQMLDLTPQQRSRIQQIIHNSQDRIAVYIQILEPDIQGVFRQMRDDIRAELTPEQRKAFEGRMQRFRKLNERNTPRANPPGPRRQPQQTTNDP
jgi:Spy/CpxP family protein refolding chaperone